MGLERGWMYKGNGAGVDAQDWSGAGRARVLELGLEKGVDTKGLGKGVKMGNGE